MWVSTEFWYNKNNRLARKPVLCCDGCNKLFTRKWNQISKDSFRHFCSKSCSNKITGLEKWSNHDYKEKMIEKQKEVQNRPEVKEKTSKHLKQLREDPAMRQKIDDNKRATFASEEFKIKKRISAQKAMANTETRQKLSESGKIAQNRPEVSANKSKKMAEIYNRPEYKKKQSERAKNSWNNPEIRSRIISSLKETLSKPEVFAKRSAAMKIVANDPIVKTKKRNTLKQNNSFRKSAVEDEIHNILCNHFKDIRRQEPINGHAIDFFILDINIYLQVDGIYWHGRNESESILAAKSNPQGLGIYKAFLRDKEQNNWFAKNNLILLRITDKEFYEFTSELELIAWINNMLTRNVA